MTIRLAALALLAVLAALPMAVLPAPPISWLAVATLVVGGAGVLARWGPLVTGGATLALIAYTLALVIERPALDPAGAIALGATLVLLLALVHFASRINGAAIAPAVIAAQVRHWLAIVVIGVLAAMMLTWAGAALSHALAGASLPIVVIAAALGALLTAAGLIALLTPPEVE